jgi:hypothetical protein
MTTLFSHPRESGDLMQHSHCRVRVLRVLLFDLIGDAMVVLDVHEVVRVTH